MERPPLFRPFDLIVFLAATLLLWLPTILGPGSSGGAPDTFMLSSTVLANAGIALLLTIRALVKRRNSK